MNDCPFVGTRDDDDARQPAQDYPSFENRCFALELVDPAQDPLERGLLLLADQATYCLGESHALCPRFRLARPGAPLPPPLAQTGESDAQPLASPSPKRLLAEEFGPPARGGLWAGLLGLLLVIFLCGGSLATYAGWRLVGQGFDTLSARLSPEDRQAGQVTLLVTATPEPGQNRFVFTPGAVAAPPSPQEPARNPTPTFDFPAAVTATPGPPPQSGPIVITTPVPADEAQSDAAPADDPADPQLLTAVAGPVLITTPGGGPATPTRRPTPVFVVPTSTPATGPQIIVVTATPDPTGGQAAEPIVSFRAAHQSLLPGACTIVSWEVENVRAVFFEGEGVHGTGERRVCVRFTSETVTLSVLRLDGVQEEHQVTVQIMPHTLTPTQTPTETPVLTPTPTWTPDGPAQATPRPPQIAVNLSVDGGNLRQCTAGASCAAQVQVRNGGDQADEIFVDMQTDGRWPAVICRSDGGCGDTSVSFGVGAGSSRPATVRVQVPGDAAGTSFSVTVGAVSGNSNRTVRAEPVQVIFSVP